MAYARIAPIGNVVTLVYDAVHAVAYGAYAIRPYNYHKPDIDYFSLNAPKTTSDMGKTMSHVGKIMSDIIQTTSGLFSVICNALENKSLQQYLFISFFCWKSIWYTVLTILAVRDEFGSGIIWRTECLIWEAAIFSATIGLRHSGVCHGKTKKIPVFSGFFSRTS